MYEKYEKIMITQKVRIKVLKKLVEKVRKYYHSTKEGKPSSRTEENKPPTTSIPDVVMFIPLIIPLSHGWMHSLHFLFFILQCRDKT